MKIICHDCNTIVTVDESQYQEGEIAAGFCPRCGAKVSGLVEKKEDKESVPAKIEETPVSPKVNQIEDNELQFKARELELKELELKLKERELELARMQASINSQISDDEEDEEDYDYPEDTLYTFDSDVDLSKLENLVNYYNEQADKNGYEPLDLDTEDGYLAGGLIQIPVEELSFKKAFRQGFNEDKMTELFNEICQLAESLSY